MTDPQPPGTAPGSHPRPPAEGDRTFAVHEFIEKRARERGSWSPCRGDLVLVHVRTGIRLRGIYVGAFELFGEEWVWVILAGKVRWQPLMLLCPFDPKKETPATPQLIRSLWG